VPAAGHAAPLSAVPAKASHHAAVTGDTTFTAAGSPYLIEDTLTIANAGSLTIEPGVEVRLAGGASVIVFGSLQCEGTASAAIRFVPAQAGVRWGVLGLSSADGTASLCFTRFHRGSTAVVEDTHYRGTVTAFSSDLSITDCEFDDTANHAISTSGCSGLIARNVFTAIGAEPVDANWDSYDVIDNQIDGAGADGIDYNYSSGEPEIRGNRITAVGDDGIDVDRFTGLVASNVVSYCSSAGITVDNHSHAVLANNVVSECYYGVSATASATVEITSSTLTCCTIGLRSAKFLGSSGSSVTGTNVLVWGNQAPMYVDAYSSAAFTYSDIQGNEVQPGEGNIKQDPLFVDPSCDFHLRPASPCIDAGWGGAGVPELDFEGDHRVDDPESPNHGSGDIAYVDIGADEYQPDIVAILPPAAPRPPTMLRAQPNPLSVGGTLTLGPAAGSGECFGKLQLYDVTGRLRRQWRRVRLPGVLAWDGRDAVGRRLAQGTYFLEFTPVEPATAPPLRTRLVIVR
jgi:hypothetical protein